MDDSTGRGDDHLSAENLAAHLCDAFRSIYALYLCITGYKLDCANSLATCCARCHVPFPCEVFRTSNQDQALRARADCVIFNNLAQKRQVYW